TPELWERWLGEKVRELRHSPAFYVRLVHAWRITIAALSRGPQPAIPPANRSLTRPSSNSYPAKPMSTLANLSVQQLKQALAIREKIESLEHQLNQLLGTSDASP